MGARVGLCARDQTKLAAIASDFKREGLKAVAVAADISQASGCCLRGVADPGSIRTD